MAYRFVDDAITIGRAGTNHLIVRHPSLSRIHAELHKSGGHWVLIDRGSRNGVRVNGHRPRRVPA